MLLLSGTRAQPLKVIRPVGPSHIQVFLYSKNKNSLNASIQEYLYSKPMKTLGERIKLSRGAMGTPTLARLASERTNGQKISQQAIQQLESGDSRGTAFLVPLARALGRNPDWLYDETGPEFSAVREALLIGKVGAGAEITRLEYPDILAGVSLPQGLDAPNVAEISGDSQYPLQEGWWIFYGQENQGVAEECLGKLCVVQVKDGPTLLKTPKRGRKGFFRLESWNAPAREDVRLAWAAAVKMIQPR